MENISLIDELLLGGEAEEVVEEVVEEAFVEVPEPAQDLTPEIPVLKIQRSYHSVRREWEVIVSDGSDTPVEGPRFFPHRFLAESVTLENFSTISFPDPPDTDLEGS